MKKKMGKSILAIMSFLIAASAAVLLSAGCPGKTPEPELEIVNEAFAIEWFSRERYTVTAAGSVRNVGEVDVENLVISGGCPSCGSSFRQGYWYEPVRDKIDEEKAVIHRLPAGAQADFAFSGLSYFPTGGGDSPDEMPGDLEVYIMSYEVSQ